MMAAPQAQFVLAAASEAVMNVWMEVLYVSMGNTMPEFHDVRQVIEIYIGRWK